MNKLSLLIFILPGILISQASLDDLKFNVFQNLNSSANQNYIRLMNEQERAEEANLNFLYDDWQKARVVSKNQQELVLDSLNYHINDENMFFMHEGKMYFLYPKEVESIDIEEKRFIALHNDSREKAHSSFSYYELLSPGNLPLLKKYYIEKKKVNNHPMGISSGIDKFDYYSKSKYYFSDENFEEFEELPRNKNKIIKVFKRNRNRMVEFARENNISPKNEIDLVKMFDYYNSIGN